MYMFVYVNDLSVKLSESRIGGKLAGKLLNHLCYADDICLVSISSAGMQKLLNICSEFASENDLPFNNKKTVCMNFKPNKMKMKDPTLYLNN